MTGRGLSDRVARGGWPARTERVASPSARGCCPGVARVDDLHVWAMSTTQVALTAHLVMPEGAPGDDFLRETAEEYAFLIDTLGAPYEPHD